MYILVDSYSFIFFSFTLLFSFRRLFCVCPSERSAQHLAVIPSCYPFCLMWNRWKTTRPSRPADCAPTPLFMTWKTKPSLMPANQHQRVPRRRRQYRPHRFNHRWIKTIVTFTISSSCFNSHSYLYRIGPLSWERVSLHGFKRYTATITTDAFPYSSVYKIFGMSTILYIRLRLETKFYKRRERDTIKEGIHMIQLLYK